MYRKNDIPERFHYRNHRRVPAIFAMARAGYTFVSNNKATEQFVLGMMHLINVLLIFVMMPL